MTRGGLARAVAAAALAISAILIAFPAALGPVRLNDSFWIDLVWLDQFARELASGTLYPRWLSLSHGGLGSPVFYYYPPLAFYLGSAFVFVGLGTFGALVAAFAAATLLSGIGVYLWLEGETRAPLAGALLYMIAPYQLFDFYQRGAIAEFLAAGMMPFVLIGIRRIVEERDGAIPIAALAYAALIMSHLPLALLASLFLIGPYGLMIARKSPHMLAKIAGALALGIALAAIYLFPALVLEPYRSSGDLWGLPTLQPATWNVWNKDAWRDQTYRSVLLVTGALLLPAAVLAVRERSGWSILAVLCIAAALGVLPAIWSLPVLRSVQFPFRLLPVAELAFVTAAMLAPKGRAPLPIAFVAFALIGVFIVAAKPESAAFGDRVMREVHPDVPENLPPGDRPYSWPSKWALEIAARHQNPHFDGKVTIEPVFYFPSWEVRCNGRPVRTFPDPSTKLLSYEGRGCSRELVRTLPEKTGLFVSLAALLVLLSLVPLSWSLGRHRSHRRGTPPRST